MESLKPRPSTLAWATIGIGVSAYELLCPDGETLSDRVDTTLEGRYKYIAMGAIAITALHLANQLDDRVDPFEQVLSRIRQGYKRRQHGTPC